MKELFDWKERDPVLRTFLLFQRTAQSVFKYSDLHFYTVLGFTTPVFITLKGLVLHGGIATHTDMAYWTNTELHNITGLVRRMIKAGLVTTERGIHDKRINYIKITDLGREKYKKARRTAAENMRGVMQGITAGQTLEFEKTLNLLLANTLSSKNK